jgi:hypothetical protein
LLTDIDDWSIIFDADTWNTIKAPKNLSLGSLTDWYLKASTKNNNYAIIDLKNAQILTLKDHWINIKEILDFEEEGNQNNLILTCDKKWKEVYVYIDLEERNEEWKLIIKKTYKNKKREWDDIKLSSWMWSPILIGEDWKIK